MSAWFLKLRHAATTGLAGLAAVTQVAPAQQLAPPPPVVRYDVRPLRDGAVFGSTSGAYLLLAVFKDDLPYATCAPCDAGRLPAMDRGAIGPPRGTPATLSNVTMLGTVAGAGLLVAGGRAWRSADAADVMVFAQTVSAASAATAVAKLAFHRPRPVLYTADAALYRTADNGLSFPSGHTALAFAAAAASASILHRRGALRRHRTAVGLLVAAAATTGVLRVAARQHFPTDAIGGAVLGTAVGWVVPAVWPLHR